MKAVEVFMGCNEVIFLGVDNRMQLRKMPAIFLLVLKLENGFC